MVSDPGYQPPADHPLVNSHWYQPQSQNWLDTRLVPTPVRLAVPIDETHPLLCPILQMGEPPRELTLKGYSTYRKTNCYISNVFKDIDNNLLDYEKMLGKPVPDILWLVPRELLTQELKEETLLKLTGSEDNPGFLGIGESKALTKGSPPECTGEVVFRVSNTHNYHRRPTSNSLHHTHINNMSGQISNLSAEGARRLTRGWATTLVAPNEKGRPCALLIQGNQKVAGKVTKTRKVRPNWKFQSTATIKHRTQETTLMRAHRHTTKASSTLSHSVVRVLSLPMLLWGKRPYGQLPGAMLAASFTPTVVVKPLGSWPVWSYILNPFPTNQHKCMHRILSQQLLPHLTSLQVRSVNSIEVWLKIKDASRRMEAWKVLDKHARKTKIPQTLFLSEEGKKANESEDSTRADIFTAEWMAGVDKIVRRVRPPAGYVEHTEDGGEKMRYSLAKKPGGQQMFGWAETEMAANADLAWRVECPFGVSSCFKDAIRAAGQEMGITLTIEEHAFPPAALEDTAMSYKLKAPTKGGKRTDTRILLKVASIPSPEDAGITHPSELAGWLLEKCGAHYIGAICDTQNVTVGDSAQSVAHLFFVLVERPPPTAKALTSKFSQAVTVRPWKLRDTLRLLQTEIYEVGGLPSVVKRDMEAGKKKVTVQNMMQEKLHNARGRAAEKGVIESGFEETLAAQSTETARITALIDATEMKIEERALNKRLRELTEAQEALAKEDAENKKQKAVPSDQQPSDPGVIKQPTGAAGGEEGEVESITILVDQQDGFFKKLKVDMEEVEPETPTLFQFMEHLFKFELGEGARTGLKSIDFCYRDEIVETVVVAMEVDQEEQQAEAAAEQPEEPTAQPVTKQVDQATQIYMECIMVKVVKQVEAADLETGKFLMDLENLRVLPVVGKDPKAKLFKFGGRKKNSIRGDTMMIRAVRPSVDRDDHPDWLYALPNELSSPEKPVGEVRATELLATNDRMCCREHGHTLDHRHPRDHLKYRKKQQQPLEKIGSPPSASKETPIITEASKERQTRGSNE